MDYWEASKGSAPHEPDSKSWTPTVTGTDMISGIVESCGQVDNEFGFRWKVEIRTDQIVQGGKDVKAGDVWVVWERAALRDLLRVAIPGKGSKIAILFVGTKGNTKLFNLFVDDELITISEAAPQPELVSSAPLTKAESDDIPF